MVLMGLVDQKQLWIIWSSLSFHLTHFLNLKWLISPCSTPLIKKSYCFMLASSFVFKFTFLFRPFTSKKAAPHQISWYLELFILTFNLSFSDSYITYVPLKAAATSAPGCSNDCIDFPLMVMQPKEREDSFSRVGC